MIVSCVISSILYIRPIQQALFMRFDSVYSIRFCIFDQFSKHSRASLNLARGVSIYLVGFGQWEFRNYFSFFSRHFLDILRWLVLVFSRGKSIAGAHTTPLLNARDTAFLWGYFWPVLYKIRICLKEIKNAQCALLSYISTWEFIFSHFSSVLKNSQVLI